MISQFKLKDMYETHKYCKHAYEMRMCLICNEECDFDYISDEQEKE